MEAALADIKQIFTNLRTERLATLSPGSALLA
jgi:hypothetical protein